MTAEPWDGTERRSDPPPTPPSVVELRRELNTVRTVMERILEIMGSFMPRQEVDQALQQERRDRFRVTLVLSAAIAILLAFVLISVVQMSQLRAVADTNLRILERVECVIEVVATVPSEAQSEAFAGCLRKESSR